MKRNGLFLGGVRFSYAGNIKGDHFKAVDRFIRLHVLRYAQHWVAASPVNWSESAKQAIPNAND